MKRSYLKRKKPMSRVAAKQRSAEEGGDEAYLAFIRSLPCCACGARAPSHAHHETGGGRGKGQKAPDRRTLPLCFRCHRQFHDLNGRFEGFTAEGKRVWQDLEILRCQELYAINGDSDGLGIF